jgi:hypothetical protein
MAGTWMLGLAIWLLLFTVGLLLGFVAGILVERSQISGGNTMTLFGDVSRKHKTKLSDPGDIWSQIEKFNLPDSARLDVFIYFTMNNEPGITIPQFCKMLVSLTEQAAANPVYRMLHHIHPRHVVFVKPTQLFRYALLGAGMPEPTTIQGGE